jgi:hypothetical protein
MEHVVQQNAALVEEASAATEAMRDEAATLLQRVARFELGGAVASLPGRAPSAAPARQLAAAVKPPQVLLAA